MVAWYHDTMFPCVIYPCHYQLGQLQELPLPSMVQLGRTRWYQVVPSVTQSPLSHYTHPRPCPTSSSLGVGAREEGSLESLLILVLLGVVVELARLREHALDASR